MPAILFSDRHGTGLSREPLHGKSCLIACYSIQFPTDHCNDPVPVLLPSFFPWWLRHGSMDPSEGTFPKVNADWNSRPFGYAPFAMSRCSCCLCDPRASPLLLKKCRSELRTTRNLLLSLMLKPCNMTRGILKATGISSSCRYGLFGIWWGQTFCASEIEQPFNAHVVWPTD